MARTGTQIDLLLDQFVKVIKRVNEIFNNPNLIWKGRGAWILDDDAGTDGESMIVSGGDDGPPRYEDIFTGVKLVCFLPGAHEASAWLTRVVFDFDATFLVAGLHRAYCTVGPTATRTFTIYKNAGSVGTVVFTNGSTTGTVTITSSFSVTDTDIIGIQAPASLDTTLVNISIILDGNRS